MDAEPNPNRSRVFNDIIQDSGNDLPPAVRPVLAATLGTTGADIFYMAAMDNAEGIAGHTANPVKKGTGVACNGAPISHRCRNQVGSGALYIAAGKFMKTF